MTGPSVLMPAPMLPSVDAALAERFALTRLWNEADAESWLAAHGHAVRGLAVSTLAGRIDATLLDRLPALEIIANFGVGTDNIDLAAARARGITVTNTAGTLDDEVADFTVGLLIATLRQIPQADAWLRAGNWRQGPFPLTATLRGRKVGVVGLGAIGKAVARRLEGFGVDLAYHGRHRQGAVAYPWHPSVTALAQACDTLIVVVPGGGATHHLIDAAVLAALGAEGVLINVARGSVVDQSALIAALANGTILAAGLDVFADEPQVPEALIALPNAVLLPHVGSGSVATRAAMGRCLVANLAGWFDGKGALTPV
jgi:lactate dehydrogenase-like 2-hydroxyacid dehydrogenase